MKKSILEKAVRLADKSRAKPEAVVVAAPHNLSKKPATHVLSERLYTRITPAEMQRLKKRIGKMIPYSELLRGLLIDYLDTKDREHDREE